MFVLMHVCSRMLMDAQDLITSKKVQESTDCHLRSF